MKNIFLDLKINKLFLTCILFSGSLCCLFVMSLFIKCVNY